jgi:hypothetical protein
MSASNQSDPRLLLPEWLRDGDLPASIKTPAEPASVQPTADMAPIEQVAVIETVEIPAPAVPAIPFSDRLSLDTRLDPGSLVSASDLPIWLGGLERVAPSTAQPLIRPSPTGAPRTVEPIEEAVPDDGVDAPQDEVIDVEVNGWIIVAGAVGLLILLAAALKLYLS